MSNTHHKYFSEIGVFTKWILANHFIYLLYIIKFYLGMSTSLELD